MHTYTQQYEKMGGKDWSFPSCRTAYNVVLCCTHNYRRQRRTVFTTCMNNIARNQHLIWVIYCEVYTSPSVYISKRRLGYPQR